MGSTRSADAAVSDSQRRAFRRDGCLHLAGTILPDQARALRAAGARLFDEDSEDRDTRKVLMPSRLDPTLASAAADPRLAAVAHRLATGPVRRFFDQLVYKPPGQARGTPWHQDFAYAATPFAPAGATPPRRHLHLWIALDPIEPEGGCIHFVRRRYSRLLPHAVVRGDPQGARTLAVQDTQQRELDRAATPYPVAPGDVTVHHDGTPHCNPPNVTAAGRMFFVVSWERTDA